MSKGTGRVYQRGNVWWIDYGFRGDRHRESSGSTRKKDAVALLRKRMKEMGEGGPRVHEEDVTLDNLTQMIEDDYKVKGRASLPNLKTALNHLRGFFGKKRRAVDIKTDQIRRYIREKQEEGYANGTIRRHLAALKRAFNLAVEADRLSRVPHFPSVQVDNVRENFLTMGDVDAICAELSDDLAPVVRFAALTGWRKGEIIALKEKPGLRWRQVDWEAGMVHLDPGTTKNGEGRTFPFSALPPLEALLRDQRERTDRVEKKTGQIVPHVFHRNGEPIRAMRKAWNKAAKAAGCEEAWFHDLRRTAVRNLERAGVPRSVATKLTGHKTEAVYRRYAIADEAALQEGVEKLAQMHEGRSGEERSAVPLRQVEGGSR
jgi:integrase